MVNLATDIEVIIEGQIGPQGPSGRGLSWQSPVISFLADPPATPSNGDRYVVITPATGVWLGKEDDIVEFDSSNQLWIFLTPKDGFALYRKSDNRAFVFTDTAWNFFGSIIDHGVLSGLGDDDHNIYHTDERGDIRYFLKTEFVSASTGTPDADKPVKTAASGKLPQSILDGDWQG